MGDFWQNPYVNIFKHYGVGQWKKCSKEGDVASLMDRVVKVIVLIYLINALDQDIVLLKNRIVT